MSNRNHRLLTIPNILTMIRLALVPVYWILMLVYKLDYWALGAFLLASATDMLDGFLARRMQCITDFGKLMDPLADKLMVLSVLCTLLIRGIIPWEPVVLLGCKELLLVIGAICMYNRNIVAHSLFVGKFAQVAVSLALILSFFHNWFVQLSIAPHLTLLWVGVGAAYTALVVYTRALIRQLRGIENTYNERK